MRVFISWSGAASHRAAEALYSWLPVMLQSIRPFLSSDDLRKGGRWNAELASELESTNFGILCVTPSNREAPWLLFEAGALSKVVVDSHVTPLLLGIKPSELPSPLTQFNATNIEKDDFWKLIKGINQVRGDEAVNEVLLRRSFDASWPSLSTELTASIEIPNDRVAKERPTASVEKFDSILQEILVLTRTQNQILGNPKSLFPIDEIMEIINNRRRSGIELDAGHPVWRSLARSIEDLAMLKSDIPSVDWQEIRDAIIDRLTGNYDYIANVIGIPPLRPHRVRRARLRSDFSEAIENDVSAKMHWSKLNPKKE